MIRALAIRPLSLTELDSIISSISYPSLERRLNAMRHEGLVEPFASQGRGTPYGVSQWLRMAATPLIDASRWERRLGNRSTPLTKRDAEATLLLALPLLRLPRKLSGSCRLSMRIDENGAGPLGGVVASVQDGKVDRCNTKFELEADG